MQVNFYRASDKKALAIELDSVKLIGWDSVMYAADSLNTIKLPLDLAQQELSFILYHKTARIDTLQIKYEFQTIALAPQCNAIDLITLSKATSKTLPSVIINQPKITNNVAENIKLYF